MSGQLEWVAVAKDQDLPEGERLVVTSNGISILLLRHAGQVYAIGSRCPHLGCSMARGKVDGFMIVCPCHDWTFDIRSGELIIAQEITMPTYHVKIDTQQIYLQIGQPGASNG